MDLKLGTSIHNRFDIRVIRDGKVVQEAYAENIVLDRMYTRICAFSTYFDYIHFGTGTGTQSASRTTLFTPTSYKSAAVVETIYAFPISKVTKKIKLMPEEFVGSSFTEVGISESTSNINTHALIKDSEGVQISITKTALDVIEIYATVYVELQNNVEQGLYWTGPASSNSILKYLVGSSALSTSSKVNTFQTYGVLPDNLTGTSVACTLQGNVASKTVKWPVTRFSIEVGNSEITRIGVSSMFTADVSKNYNGMSYQGVSVGTGDGVTVKFPIDKKYISNLVVKVDGVETADYTTSTIAYSKILNKYKITDIGGNITLFGDNPKYGIKAYSHGASYMIEMGGDEVYKVLRTIPQTVGLPGYYLDYRACTKGLVVCNIGEHIPGYYDYWQYRNELYRYNFETNEYTLLFRPINTFERYGYYAISVSTEGTFALGFYGSIFKMIKINSDNTTVDIPISGTPNGSNGSSVWVSDDTVGIYNGRVYSFYKFNGTSFVYVSQIGTSSDTFCCNAYKGSIMLYSSATRNITLFKMDLTTGAIVSTDVLKTYTAADGDFQRMVTVELDDGYVGVVLNTISSHYLYVFSGGAWDVSNLVVIYNFLGFSATGSLNSAYFDSLNDTLTIGEGNAVCTYDCNKNGYQSLVFNSAPASGAVITADYSTSYLTKTTDYVLDVGFTIQFGEGTV